MMPTDNRPRDTRYPDDRYLQTAMENDARLQSDPELALSGGKASRTQIWATAFGTLLVLGIVLYGVTQTPKEPRTAAAPPAAETTGAAPAAEPQQPGPARPGPADSAR